MDIAFEGQAAQKIQFICPDCHSPLDETQAGLECERCKKTFPIIEGLHCFKLAPSDHGELRRDEMATFIELAKRDGWRAALHDFAAPRRPNVGSLLTDPRRGWVADLMEEPNLETVLDLGCGYGGVSLQLAEKAKQVVSLDGSIERVSFLNVVRSQEGISNIVPVTHNDILRLPFPDSSFDSVLMIGVLEYLPASLSEHTVRIAHWKSLGEIARVLRPGGKLIIGTKNRFSFDYIRGKADHNGLPFGPALPRWLADVLLRVFFGRRYRIINYSLRGYRRLLLESCFDRLRFYRPYGGYQMPEELVPIDDRKAILSGTLCARLSGMKRIVFERLDRLGLLKFLVGNYIIVARKPDDASGAGKTK